MMLAGLAVIYVAAAIWVRLRAPVRVRNAALTGMRVGTVVAAIAAVNHVVEMWISLPVWLGTLLGAGMWGVMFFAFGTACSLTYAREKSAGLGVLSSLACGATLAALLVAFALAIGFAFMAHMREVLAPLYAQSGMTDPDAFVVRHLLGAAREHLVIAPIVATIVGSVSVVAVVLLESVERRTAVILTVASVAVLAAGAASLRFASSLERSERPPFVMFGLVALCAALASAHPLLRALAPGASRRTR